MELLKQRILQDGRCYPGGILKVDSYGGLYHAVAGGLRKEEETEDDGEYALYRGPFLHEGS